MNASLKYYLELPYKLELLPVPGEGWAASVPELPGCVTMGETREEALELIEDAQELWLSTALEIGREIPQPQDVSGKTTLRMGKQLHRRLSEQAARDQVSLNQHIVNLLQQTSMLWEVRRELREAVQERMRFKPEAEYQVISLMGPRDH